MSFTLIPGRNRGRHDPDEVIARLQSVIARLLNRQAAADDFFAVLLNDVNETNRAWQQEKRHRKQAETALSEAWEYIRELEDELAPHRAAEANATAVTVPPMERDTSAIEDQATAPIDVRTLRQAAEDGLLSPVVRISASGATADPRPRQTTWGRDADTRPLAKAIPAA